MKTTVTLLCALVLAILLNVSHTPAIKDEGVQRKQVTQFAKADNEPSFEEQFYEHVQHWITTLAEEPQFATWRNAYWERAPLGPGMHGWIVLIYSSTSQQEIGYLVVNDTMEGELQLAEYGLGDFPLFSNSTLNRTIDLQEQIQQLHIRQASQYDAVVTERMYFNPFQAVWQLNDEEQVIYFDGVTGEEYDLNVDIIKNMGLVHSQGHLISNSTKLLQQEQFPLFDPYEIFNWLIDEPFEVATFDDLLQALAEPPHEVTYTASIFADSIRMPLAITGYHLWDNAEPYIMIDQHSYRFIPFSALLQQGLFYIK